MDADVTTSGSGADARVGTVPDLLRHAGLTEPERIALSEAATGRAISWRGLDDLTDRVAAGLFASDLVAGQRVLIAMVNRIEFVAAYLGVLRAGMVAVPVNPRSATGELIGIFADSGARLALCDDNTIAVVRAAATGLAEAMAAGGDPAGGPRIVVVGATVPGERGWREFIDSTTSAAPVREDAESLAVLLYTSGTSGKPRAAMLSHRALRSNVEQVARIEPPMIVGQDVVLGILPLFHVYGLNAVLGQAMRQCARLVLVDRFEPEGTLDLIEDEAISVLPLAPPVFAYWMQVPGLEERMGPVRLVLSGSAPLSPELTAAFTERTGLEIHQGYGLTEAAPVVTWTQGGDEHDPRSVGAPLPGVELKLVEADGYASDEDDAGQIVIRGANLFSGYWPDGADGPDEEGWFATGDVGYLDDRGELHLVDRVKDLIIVSGFNVYPVEVEEVIAELSDVAGVAVVGVPHEITGEAVVAYVRPAPGVNTETLADQVREHCARRLARFKQPDAVHVVEALPYTATGKVQKGRLREAERRRALGLLE
jgi:long-chain acyl-CoA synthetase